MGSGDRYKLLMMKLSEDQRTIVMDHQESLKIKDLVSGEDVFKKVVGMFPENDCRYAVYDCSYTFSGHVRKALVLITWVPDSTPTKTKMAYLSSKDSLLKRFQVAVEFSRRHFRPCEESWRSRSGVFRGESSVNPERTRKHKPHSTSNWTFSTGAGITLTCFFFLL
ncbi:uncharacterized protein [Hoplias malabaricus]|uniref:uncharacterized protein isoform X2 n=1 Tax=Hoplias malabaricus TaxID=27720 RepID=UPI003461F0E9